MSNFFSIHRGVRQGCPLSTYLFIICIELLSYKISTNEDLKSIHFLEKNLEDRFLQMMRHLYWTVPINHLKHLFIY